MTDIRATLNKIAPAVEQLARHQQQADADGVMVTVSRQAVDEVVNSINEIAISLSAAPGEPCAVKPLEWRDHRPDSFPEPAWSAHTPFGFYNIEEVSASDSPAYVVRLHAHHFIADKDGLDEAKAAAQADYEQRIRSALVTTPQPAAGWDIEEIAQWLHDETGHPHSYPNHTWPETERDDGQRAGAFVKIVPLHAQEYFRDIARRLVTQLDRSALRREAPAPVDTRDQYDVLGDPHDHFDAARPDTAEARLNDKRNIIQNAIIRCPSFSDLHKAPNLCAYDIADDIIAALSPPSGGDEAKKSEGGVEGHASPRPSRAGQETRHLQAGIKPGPSEPSPPADRRESGARAACKAKGVNPDCLHQNYGDEPIDHTDAQGRTFHYGWRNQLHVVDAILAALDGGR
jgi:hypothetical protein